MGVGTCALVGLYPLFDEGRLRVVLGLTTAAFGGVVMWLSLHTKSRAGAIASTIGLSTVLGAVNTFLPAVLLWSRGTSDVAQLGAMLFFGLIFGVPTGLGYGLALAPLVALVHRPHRPESWDVVDNAKLRAAMWTAVLAAMAFLGGATLDAPLAALTVALGVFAASVCLAGIVAFQDHARQAWTSRVRRGLDPHFRVRALEPGDPAGLPRLAEGAHVIEAMPFGNENIYRVAASGVAVAIVADA